MTLRSWTATALIVGASIAANAQDSQSAGPTQAAAEAGRVEVPGTRVSLIPPPGLKLSELFPGFIDRETGARIVVAAVPAGFDAVAATLTTEQAANRGMTITSRETSDAAGARGLLIGMLQEADNAARSMGWLGLLGDTQGAVLITASYPDTVAERFADPMRSAVLSARWVPEDRERPAFVVEKSGELDYAMRTADSLILTTAGKKPPLTPRDAMFVVSRMGPAGEADLAKIAETALKSMPAVAGVELEAGGGFEIGGRPAYEMTALAYHNADGTQMLVHQIVTEQDGRIYVMQGLVDNALRDRYLGTFRKVARTLTMVPPEPGE